MRPSTAGSGSASGFSFTIGLASSRSKMRSAPARACWPTAISTANIRTGATSCTMYDEKARNVPRLISPWMASHPPKASTAT